MLGTLLFSAAYLVALGTRGWALLFPLMALPFFVLAFVLPMTVIAAGVRWLWLRLAPVAWREAFAPAVAGGVLAGPLGLLLLDLLTGVVSPWDVDALSRSLEAWWIGDVGFAPPLLLGGAAVGYLAHRRAWPGDLRWWVVIIATCVLALLLLVPLDPALPSVG